MEAGIWWARFHCSKQKNLNLSWFSKYKICINRTCLFSFPLFTFIHYKLCTMKETYKRYMWDPCTLDHKNMWNSCWYLGTGRVCKGCLHISLLEKDFLGFIGVKVLFTDICSLTKHNDFLAVAFQICFVKFIYLFHKWCHGKCRGNCTWIQVLEHYHYKVLRLGKDRLHTF